MKTLGRRFTDSMDKDPARGNRLRALRDRAGLTQQQVARSLDVSDKTVWNWEAGHGISAKKRHELAELLHVGVEELSGAAEIPSPFKIADHLSAEFTWLRNQFEQLQEHMTEQDADRHEQVEAAMLALKNIEGRLEKLEDALDVTRFVDRIIAAAERLEAGAPQRPRKPRGDERAAS